MWMLNACHRCPDIKPPQVQFRVLPRSSSTSGFSHDLTYLGLSGCVYSVIGRKFTANKRPLPNAGPVMAHLITLLYTILYEIVQALQNYPPLVIIPMYMM